MKKEEKIQKLIEIAEDLLGAPYEYGAYLKKNTKRKPGSFDCSSFIQYLFAQIGVDLPRSSILQAAKGKEIKDNKNLQAGDVIFFEGAKGHYSHKLFHGRKIYIGHVALYIGNGQIIHAQENRGVVVKQKLQTLAKNKHYKPVLIKRYV